MQFLNSVVHLVSIMGNSGLFMKATRHVFTNFEFVYHMTYMLVTILALCCHEFFYSLMVRPPSTILTIPPSRHPSPFLFPLSLLPFFLFFFLSLRWSCSMRVF